MTIFKNMLTYRIFFPSQAKNVSYSWRRYFRNEKYVHVVDYFYHKHRLKLTKTATITIIRKSFDENRQFIHEFKQNLRKLPPNLRKLRKLTITKIAKCVDSFAAFNPGHKCKSQFGCGFQRVKFVCLFFLRLFLVNSEFAKLS